MIKHVFLLLQSAREALDGADILGQAISVDWCFVKGPTKTHKKRR